MHILRSMLFFGLVCGLFLLPGSLSAAEPAKPVNFQTIPGALPAQLDPDDNANLSRMSNRALDAALRARQAYFEQAGFEALAKDALNPPEQAPATSLPDPGLAADLRGAGLTSVGGTVDEPTGEVALPVDPALSCPGFYILRTHPGAGSLAGRIGAEILLDGSGLRTLQGGLNFGGQATASIRGFSAFSIANANDEDQVVNIGLDAAASGRLVLERRSGGTTTVLIDQAVGAGETDVTATVAPGFYVVGYQPNRSEPTNYTVAALTSFTDRAGGGFQGGVVFGGYHNPTRESTGFGGFCIAEAFDVSVSVLSQPTYGSSGAKGMAFSVSSGDGAVFLDSRRNETVKLNDTGIDWCADFNTNNLDCPVLDWPGQDGDFGRDALARDGQLDKVGAGAAGFDFTKLDANGNDLPVTAMDWSCVRDNHTGLIWEVKTDDGGLRDKDNTYSWYNPDSDTNGGDAGSQDFGSCVGSACDTSSFADAVNAQGLCGASDWRIPGFDELVSIVHYGRRFPAIDTDYFPSTTSDDFWSAQAAEFSIFAWEVNFNEGYDSDNFKSASNRVRLVRRGQ